MVSKCHTTRYINTTHNQYRMFSIAIGAANVLTKLAHPAVIWKTIMPLARISSGRVSVAQSHGV